MPTHVVGFNIYFIYFYTAPIEQELWVPFLKGEN